MLKELVVVGVADPFGDFAVLQLVLLQQRGRFLNPQIMYEFVEANPILTHQQLAEIDGMQIKAPPIA